MQLSVIQECPSIFLQFTSRVLSRNKANCFCTKLIYSSLQYISVAFAFGYKRLVILIINTSAEYKNMTSFFWCSNNSHLTNDKSNQYNQEPNKRYSMLRLEFYCPFIKISPGEIVREHKIAALRNHTRNTECIRKQNGQTFLVADQQMSTEENFSPHLLNLATYCGDWWQIASSCIPLAMCIRTGLLTPSDRTARQIHHSQNAKLSSSTFWWHHVTCGNLTIESEWKHL